MSQTVKYIIEYANPLIHTNSSTSFKKVCNLMLGNNISLLPIIDQKGKKNVGTFIRKDLFKWLIFNQKKNISAISKTDLFNSFKRPPLPEVKIYTPLKEAMEALKTSSAVLIRNEDKEYTHLITPRVIANSLDGYSSRFMLVEEIEKEIRAIIQSSDINLKGVNPDKHYNSFPTDVNHLEFGQYHYLFSIYWDKIGLDHLDKKYFLKLLRETQDYRNSIMHFRLDNNSEGIHSAQTLLNLLK